MRRAGAPAAGRAWPALWHVLSDPDASYRDIGPGFYDTRPGRQHRERDLIHLTGQHVTLQPKPGEHAAAA